MLRPLTRISSCFPGGDGAALQSLHRLQEPFVFCTFVLVDFPIVLRVSTIEHSNVHLNDLISVKCENMLY